LPPWVATLTLTLCDDTFVEDQRRVAEKARKEDLDNRSPSRNSSEKTVRAAPDRCTRAPSAFLMRSAEGYMWKWMLPVLALTITSPAAIAGPEDDCRQNGDWKLQVIACSEIVSRGDAPAWVYESRGRAYWRRGDRKQAIADLKLFAQALERHIDGDLDAIPPDRIIDAALKTLKSYICLYLIRHYAGDDPAKKVDVVSVQAGDYKNDLFGTEAHKTVCGEIAYDRPERSAPTRAEEIAHVLSAINELEFNNLRVKLDDLARHWYLNAVRAPSAKLAPAGRFLEIVGEYASDRRISLGERHAVVLDRIKQAADRIIAEAAAPSGTAMGDWFSAIRLEQSKIIAGHLNIPIATGPDEKLLQASYGDAFGKYAEFLTWLTEATPPAR
jgi:hypothetical protein